MIEFFDKLGIQKFKRLTILFCLAGDWIVSAYVIIGLVRGRDVIRQLFETAVQQQGLPPEEIDLNIIDHYYQMGLKVGFTMIGIVLLFHILCYWLFYKGKGFARAYVKSLGWMGAIGYLLFSLTSFQSPIFASVLFIQFLLYVFVILGFKNINMTE